MNFKNKVVVITGASSGIGKASAIKFAKKNAKVVLVARRKEKLLQVEKEISQYADSTLVCQCDVSNKSKRSSKKELILLAHLSLLCKYQSVETVDSKMKNLEINALLASLPISYRYLIFL